MEPNWGQKHALNEVESFHFDSITFCDVRLPSFHGGAVGERPPFGVKLKSSSSALWTVRINMSDKE
jgi:hypothetical protein